MNTRNGLIAILHFAGAAIIAGFVSCTPKQEPARKVVFIIVDGIPADVVERVATPALDSISEAGGYARAYVGGEAGDYTESPTISAVGYNSLLTGVWANKHNVWDNDIAKPNYHYWNLFRLFKDQYPAKTTAVFSTWIDNRARLVGSNAREAGNLQPEFYFDGMELDTIGYPHDTAGHFYHLIDEAVTDTAAANIRRNAPDLSWIYLEFTDAMGHRHGNGPKMDDAVMKIDNQIKRIWQAIRFRERNFNEEWQLWITTDHGREENGYHHGGQTARERTTWIATNAKGLDQRFKGDRAAIVDILPSIAAFLGMRIPREKMMELDGVPLTGDISAMDGVARYSDGRIRISWKPVDKKGIAKIWLAATNNFMTGGKDNYELVKEVPVDTGSAELDVEARPSDFYKVVLEMPHNFLNRWVIIKK